jgi:hypothetical protein
MKTEKTILRAGLRATFAVTSSSSLSTEYASPAARRHHMISARTTLSRKGYSLWFPREVVFLPDGKTIVAAWFDALKENLSELHNEDGSLPAPDRA